MNVFKVETDRNPDIKQKYKVRHVQESHFVESEPKVYGLPTIMLFKDGEMIEGSQREGAITQEAILEYLDSFGIISDS